MEETQNPSKVSEVLVDISTRIKESNPQVRELLISHLVNKEVQERVDLLDKTLEKRTNLDRDLKKISRPDIEILDAEGKVVSSSYSKSRVEELKKSREQLQKLDKALEKALEGDFSKVKELK